MLKRCYSENLHKSSPTYLDCEVCDEWKTFSNFRSWMESQDWEGKELDKDLLGNGKLYSPDTCTFLPRIVNSFLLENKSRRGKTLLGVSKRKNRFYASCKDTFTGNKIYLGCFKDQVSAHKAWIIKKCELAETLSKLLNKKKNQMPF